MDINFVNAEVVTVGPDEFLIIGLPADTPVEAMEGLVADLKEALGEAARRVFVIAAENIQFAKGAW